MQETSNRLWKDITYTDTKYLNNVYGYRPPSSWRKVFISKLNFTWTEHQQDLS
jgi:hypothetical protein